jgi:uncharacterized RDD family membrane protein YckC
MTCPKCGRAVQADQRFCPNCGTTLQATPTAPSAGRTGFDQLGSDQALQGHWLRRVVALVIDAVVVTAALAIIFLVIWVPFAIGSLLVGVPAGFPDLPFFFSPFGFLFTFPFLAGLLYLLYFAFAESSYGTTLGKRAMGLRVETTTGTRVGLDKGFLRNLSKLHWILLLLDVVVGLATTGDARQKFSDRFAGTRVVPIG